MAFLEIRNLKKSYKDGINILNGVSLEVKRGEVLVILGPSGCGKSSLLRCINGLEKIQGGEIFLDNKLISKPDADLRSIRQKVGMVFQNYELFPNMTVLQNVTLGPTKAQKRDKAQVQNEAKNLLSRVGLLDKINAYPKELSGGQKQRVAIVRALCMNPEVLLFDEVTAALDPEMVHEVLDVIIGLAKEGRTMLIVTHQLDFARVVADKIVFIDQGVIVEESKPEEFFTKPKTERAKNFLEAFQYEKQINFAEAI